MYLYHHLRIQYLVHLFFLTISGVTAACVDVEHVPCSATTMAMFSCLQDPSNGIVRSDGSIVQREYEEIDNYTVADELRNVRTRLFCILKDSETSIENSVGQFYNFRVYLGFARGHVVE
jgi:hypothetical protein